MRLHALCAGLVLFGLWGCGESDEHFGGAPLNTAAPSATATAVGTRTPSPTVTPIVGTPTVTPTLGAGANVLYVGLLHADESPIPPTTFDALGRPVFERTNGSGFFLVVDAKPGTNGAAVGRDAYKYDANDPSVRPDLQMEVSRNLGDGSATVCDNSTGHFGGVPGIDPASFDPTQPISDAFNDLGCRFDDGMHAPRGRGPEAPCTAFPDGDFHFIDPAASVEFCGLVSQPFAFPAGDTIVTVRVRDTSGIVGPPRQMVVRVDTP